MLDTEFRDHMRRIMELTYAAIFEQNYFASRGAKRKCNNRDHRAAPVLLKSVKQPKNKLWGMFIY